MSRKSPLKKRVISEKDYYKNYGKQDENRCYYFVVFL